MNCVLYKQFPKSKNCGEGYVDCDGKKIIMFSKNDRILEELEKPEIVDISMNGILLKGYEPDGVDKRGVKKFKYQEWFLVMD